VLHPRVSVIVIFFNEERFLKEAVESVFRQTCQDWELLLVDDGSSDRSADVARSCAAGHGDRVIYLTHDGGGNRGKSAARNLGLRHARGEFVGFLDADDIWMPIKLEEQIRILEREKAAAMVYGRTLIWFDPNEEWRRECQDFYYDLGLEADCLHSPPGPFLVLVANKSQTPTTCNALLRRSVIEALGGFEDEFREMFEDQVFFAKIMLENPVYVSSRTWAKYRQHPFSTSTLADRASVHRARVAFLRWLASYMKGRGFSEAVCRRAVARETWKEFRQIVQMTIRSIVRVPK
jgi:glycosyltransferase involved in cell wall biosynthesis